MIIGLNFKLIFFSFIEIIVFFLSANRALRLDKIFSRKQVDKKRSIGKDGFYES